MQAELSNDEYEMDAVVTTGTGGYDKLVYRKVPVPVPGPDEVLLRVLAAGVNNTEINTRLGWYSSSVTEGTGETADEAARPTAAGTRTTPFPLIQGTDCCGAVVAVGEGGDDTRIGDRVLVRACMRSHGFDRMDTIWLGSDFDGAFAQYVKVPAGRSLP
jgi:NADPH:quinone reductase-like Zn-dependent oxidoreductase